MAVNWPWPEPLRLKSVHPAQACLGWPYIETVRQEKHAVLSYQILRLYMKANTILNHVDTGPQLRSIELWEINVLIWLFDRQVRNLSPKEALWHAMQLANNHHIRLLAFLTSVLCEVCSKPPLWVASPLPQFSVPRCQTPWADSVRIAQTTLGHHVFSAGSLSWLDTVYMEKWIPLMFDVFQSCTISLRSFGGENLSLVLSQHEKLDTNLCCMICKHHGFLPPLTIRQYLISFWSDVCSVNKPSFQLNVTHIPKTSVPSRMSGVADGRDGRKYITWLLTSSSISVWNKYHRHTCLWCNVLCTLF